MIYPLTNIVIIFKFNMKISIKYHFDKYMIIYLYISYVLFSNNVAFEATNFLHLGH